MPMLNAAIIEGNHTTEEPTMGLEIETTLEVAGVKQLSTGQGSAVGNYTNFDAEIPDIILQVWSINQLGVIWIFLENWTGGINEQLSANLH